MQILILSDVHGNRFALQAVLEAELECDAILCLGDIVGYGAHPNECCALLREAEADCLSGNHDAAALGKINSHWFNATAETAILWTRAQLSPENKVWLNALPAQNQWPNWEFQAVHASLRKPWEEYIIDPAVALPTMQRMVWPLCFYGHTHRPDFYRCWNVQTQLLQLQQTTARPGDVLEIEERETGWQFLVNPGSCGQPRDGDPRAKYAIFDTDSGEIEFFGQEYDVKAARTAILEAGLPHSLGDRLLRGQ